MNDRMAYVSRPAGDDGRVDLDFAKAAVGKAMFDLEMSPAVLADGSEPREDLFVRHVSDRLDRHAYQVLGRVTVEFDGRGVGGKDRSLNRVDLQDDCPVVGKQPAVGLFALAELCGPLLDLVFEVFVRLGNRSGHCVKRLGQHADFVVGHVLTSRKVLPAAICRVALVNPWSGRRLYRIKQTITPTTIREKRIVVQNVLIAFSRPR